MTSCLVQVLVAIFSLANLPSIDLHFFTIFLLYTSGINSKIMMIYLTFDRVLNVYYHLRYVLQFTKARVVKTLIVLWMIA